MAPVVQSGPILTAEQRAHYHEQGFVVVPDAVPPALLEAVVAAIWEFLGMDPREQDDWYREPLRRGGMVEMYQHQAMWDVRQHARLHAIFAEIIGTPRLWVSIDRVSMKPPRHPDHPEYAHDGFMHWDANLDGELGSFQTQGVLALTDTAANQGGFQCVPGSHRRFHALVAGLDEEQRRRRCPDLAGMEVTPIPMRAGDLVIWTPTLLHGNGENRSDRPRLAQYVAMYRADDDDEVRRAARVDHWRRRVPPPADYFPGDPRGWEQQHGETAVLTPLGRKLLGLDRWEAAP